MPTFTDDFNRADGSLTSPWALSDGDGPTIPAIAGNRASGTLGGAHYTAFLMQGAVQSVSVELPVLLTSYFGLILGCTAANNGYYGYWTPTAGGAFEIYLYTGGVFGAAKTATAGTITAGQTLRFARTARTLTLSVNGTDVLSWTDPNDTFPSGYPGFGIEDTTVRADNFTANYTSGPTLPLMTRRRR